MLLLAILFLNPVTSFESYAIDAPFKYSLRKLNGHSYKNSVTVYTIKDELTGMVKVDSQCKLEQEQCFPVVTTALFQFANSHYLMIILWGQICSSSIQNKTPHSITSYGDV